MCHNKISLKPVLTNRPGLTLCAYGPKACLWSYISLAASGRMLSSHVNQIMYVLPGGATRMARGGIRLVHGHTKSTLITYFSGMKIDPNYAFLKAFFLNLSVMSFSKYVYMTKNTPFFPILHVFAPLNAVRAYSGWSWKTTLITWIFGRAWYPPWHSSGPPRMYYNVVHHLGFWNSERELQNWQDS